MICSTDMICQWHLPAESWLQVPRVPCSRRSASGRTSCSSSAMTIIIRPSAFPEILMCALRISTGLRPAVFSSAMARSVHRNVLPVAAFYSAVSRFSRTVS